jgi:aminomethyltransferase
MPVQYAPGILKEHLHTRTAAGLFDVSHMGQIALRPKSGRVGDAARALERLVPADILGLQSGRQRYTCFTNDNGGILDDLMVANRGDHLLLVVNASCKAADEEHLRSHLSRECEIERLDRALIALQGPRAEAALARVAAEAASMRFMDVRALPVLGAACVVARSGYTGEDGFEISTPPDEARQIAAALLKDTDAAPIGLGARDSLRLEAGLPLHGSDIDATTTPVEAGLAWAIQRARRRGGEREAGFPGAAVVMKQLAEGPSRLRVGLRPEGRQPVRAGALVFDQSSDEEPIGSVTSGGFGPSLGAPVAMAYVPRHLSTPGTKVLVEVRGQRLEATICELPFVAHRYKREIRPNS